MHIYARTDARTRMVVQFKVTAQWFNARVLYAAWYLVTSRWHVNSFFSSQFILFFLWQYGILCMTKNIHVFLSISTSFLIHIILKFEWKKLSFFFTLFFIKILSHKMCLKFEMTNTRSYEESQKYTLALPNPYILIFNVFMINFVHCSWTRS